MKREIPPPIAVALVAALVLVAFLTYSLVRRARNPVRHIGRNEQFDLKTGRTIPRTTDAPAR